MTGKWEGIWLALKVVGAAIMLTLAIVSLLAGVPLSLPPPPVPSGEDA